MFNASLEIKCLIFSMATLSQSYPSLEHLLTASNFLATELNSFIIFDPQDGHFFGN